MFENFALTVELADAIKVALIFLAAMLALGALVTVTTAGLRGDR